jgi:predicted flap endonuclease-1-like 5' DNA nuclease
MTVILGLALWLVSAVGFIIAWALGVGASLGLVVGVLLVLAGAIIGFISEWLIDEAYRKNRELRRLLGERGNVALGLAANVSAPVPPGGTPGGEAASESLSAVLQRRDDEQRQLREQVAAADVKLDGLQHEFGAYQQSHPDDLAVIKGIGPVYQWKRRDAGFHTYQQLATADPEQLRRMLDIKNWQRVKVESWIEQARDWARRG